MWFSFNLYTELFDFNNVLSVITNGIQLVHVEFQIELNRTRSNKEWWTANGGIKPLSDMQTSDLIIGRNRGT